MPFEPPNTTGMELGSTAWLSGPDSMQGYNGWCLGQPIQAADSVTVFDIDSSCWRISDEISQPFVCQRGLCPLSQEEDIFPGSVEYQAGLDKAE